MAAGRRVRGAAWSQWHRRLRLHAGDCRARVLSVHSPMTGARAGRSSNSMPKRTSHRTRLDRLALITALLAGALSLAGCRDSAPDDLILQTSSTDALVFVKADAEETLNRTNGS